ncbi:hypothetical protein NDU88_002645 [Pleurodeles waltl]|uniref:Uncharacterized protein n=1 Tax=Pleurodeles waltl TaxID=8319 RepID=A0AAV7P8V5_PLEWA|nr:hypothetical protein NDU88_002645 [Pleurodeles waltl]
MCPEHERRAEEKTSPTAGKETRGTKQELGTGTDPPGPKKQVSGVGARVPGQKRNSGGNVRSDNIVRALRLRTERGDELK